MVPAWAGEISTPPHHCKFTRRTCTASLYTKLLKLHRNTSTANLSVLQTSTPHHRREVSTQRVLTIQTSSLMRTTQGDYSSTLPTSLICQLITCFYISATCRTPLSKCKLIAMANLQHTLLTTCKTCHQLLLIALIKQLLSTLRDLSPFDTL